MRSLTFFIFVNCNFGSETVKYMKKWTNTQKSITKMKLRISFLKNCIKHNVISPHLNRWSSLKNNLYHYRSVSKYNSILKRLIFNMIKVEISDAHRFNNSALYETVRLARSISHHLPIFLCNDFLKYQNRSLYFHFESERNRLNKKFDWLLKKQITTQNKKIRPVHYFCSINNVPLVTTSRKCLRSNCNQPVVPNRANSFSFNPIPHLTFHLLPRNYP